MPKISLKLICFRTEKSYYLVNLWVSRWLNSNAHRYPWHRRRRRRAARRTPCRPCRPASSLTHSLINSTPERHGAFVVRRASGTCARAPPDRARARRPRPPPPLVRIAQSPRFISNAFLFPCRVLFEACWCIDVSSRTILCSMRGV